MDLLDSLTTDYDELCYRAAQCKLAIGAHRESLFIELSRLQAITGRAEQVSLMGWRCTDKTSAVIRDFAESYQCMEEFALSILETENPKFREAKIELYCALVQRRVTDASKLLLPDLFDQMPDEGRERAARIYSRYLDDRAVIDVEAIAV